MQNKVADVLLTLGVPFAEEYSPRANFFGIDIASEPPLAAAGGPVRPPPPGLPLAPAMHAAQCLRALVRRRCRCCRAAPGRMPSSRWPCGASIDSPMKSLFDTAAKSGSPSTPNSSKRRVSSRVCRVFLSRS